MYSNGESIKKIIFYSLGYFLTFFSSLIYNEIIVCNFWGLNINTKIYIEDRQQKEINSFKLNESENQSVDQDQNEKNENEYIEYEGGYLVKMKK